MIGMEIGKYRITVKCGNYTMIGPEIKLSETNPIAEYNFVKGESIDLTIRGLTRAQALAVLDALKS